MENEKLIILENERYYLRDDVASSIVVNGDGRRYSVFSKVDNRRLIVYNGTEEYARSEFLREYSDTHATSDEWPRYCT